MTNVNEASDHLQRLGRGKAADADTYATQARALIAQHLEGITKNEMIISAIQEEAVRALPGPVMRGQTTLRFDTQEEVQGKLRGFESSLDTRGLYEDTIKSIMADMQALAGSVFATRSGGKSGGI